MRFSNFCYYRSWSFSLLLVVDKCDVPLGIQDGRITQSMMSASSFYNRYYGPWSARLQARNHGATRGGWLARVNNNRQWLQIDLGAKSVVKRISTQGRYDANQWVTSYTLSYSQNGVRFYPYRENRRTRVSGEHITELVLNSLVILEVWSWSHETEWCTWHS